FRSDDRFRETGAASFGERTNNQLLLPKQRWRDKESNVMEDNSALRDVLWKMYHEHCTQGRHHETQRSSVASALIAISGGVIGLITFDKAVTATDLPLAVF